MAQGKKVAAVVLGAAVLGTIIYSATRSKGEEPVLEPGQLQFTLLNPPPEAARWRTMFAWSYPDQEVQHFIHPEPIPVEESYVFGLTASMSPTGVGVVANELVYDGNKADVRIDFDIYYEDGLNHVMNPERPDRWWKWLWEDCVIEGGVAYTFDWNTGKMKSRRGTQQFRIW